MTYLIKTEFRVKGLNSNKDARAMGNSIAEHVLDTFNDDLSIDPLVFVEFVRAPKKGTRK
jgi:hypothetical protein